MLLWTLGMNRLLLYALLGIMAFGLFPKLEAEDDPVVDVGTPRVVRDIVFLVDGSSYVGSNFHFVLDFISSVVNRLDVRPEGVRIGLMQFSDGQRTEFFLKTPKTKKGVLSAIDQMILMGGETLNIGAAIQYALDNHFQPAVGSRRRQGIQQVMVLIIGGPSQDEVKRVEGVLTFAVGAGQVEEHFLKTIAFSEDLAYYRSNFADLSSVVEQIMTPLITVVGETNTTTERDVAFLIDGSDDVRGDFPYIRDFISKVIEPLDIGINKVRVSVVQHSERPSPSFYLNTYQTKDEVLRAVKGLTLAGGRRLNTGAALTFMKNTILSAEYGSRADENVPQFLIVLTGGRSRDSVREPAVALKTEGVVPFGVGVKNADPKQIEAISHNPSFAFNVKEFSQLNTVQERLKNYVNLSDQKLKDILKKDSKTVLIVYAHQSAGSFNAAAKDAAVDVLEKRGHNVLVSDLYAMKFKATATKKDITGPLKNPENFCYEDETMLAWQEGRLASDIVEEQKKLKEADIVIFQFPMYWLSVPAIMKGWMDRVLTYGFAYTLEKRYSEGIFREKKAMLSFTTGSHETMLNSNEITGNMNVTLWPIQNGVLNYCGFQVLAPQIFWAPTHLSAEARGRLLEGWSTRLKGLLSEVPLAFPPVDLSQS